MKISWDFFANSKNTCQHIWLTSTIMWKPAEILPRTLHHSLLLLICCQRSTSTFYFIFSNAAIDGTCGFILFIHLNNELIAPLIKASDFKRTPTFGSKSVHPTKTNMEPTNWWFIIVSPFPRGYFPVSFRGMYIYIYTSFFFPRKKCVPKRNSLATIDVEIPSNATGVVYCVGGTAAGRNVT